MSTIARVLLAIALLSSGCELNETCDPNTDPGCKPPVGDGGTDTDAKAIKSLPYTFVYVADLTSDGRNGVGGADIIGIELIQGGSSFYASQVHSCEFGALDNSLAKNCNVAQGVPTQDPQSCPTPPVAGQADFVSLGGTGGSLIVSFGLLKPIFTGDQIIVHACKRLTGDELYNVYVGPSAQPSDPQWVSVIASGEGTQQGVVPTLPAVPSN